MELNYIGLAILVYINLSIKTKPLFILVKQKNWADYIYYDLITNFYLNKVPLKISFLYV